MSQLRNKVMVLLTEYRTPEKPYTNVFVHSRVKAYIENGIDVTVFVLNNKDELNSYTIDGVKVICGGIDGFSLTIRKRNIKNVCVHFICPEMIQALNKSVDPLNIVITVHGNEALHWYQRIFPGVFSNPRLILGTIKGAFYNQYSIAQIRRFLSGNKHKIEFVTVSEWMKDAAEKTWKCAGKFEWHIIPNVINTERFAYQHKHPEDRFQMLSIRPFATGKYANDITAKLLLMLSEESVFSLVNVTWIGAGVLYNQTVRPVKKLNNVKLMNKMLPQEEIPLYHQKNGLFICPTRQDAQGVSMCEAMSSGLVPITLYNTAIPEYLPNDERLICHNVEEMKHLVMRLLNDEKMFLELSRKCSDYIQKRCSYENTIMKEIELFRSNSDMDCYE